MSQYIGLQIKFGQLRNFINFVTAVIITTVTKSYSPS